VNFYSALLWYIYSGLRYGNNNVHIEYSILLCRITDWNVHYLPYNVAHKLN